MKDFKKSHSFGQKSFGARPSFGGHSDETHKTTCNECHAMCEVPFKPNGKKPVYCRNCYKGKETTTSFTGQPFSRPTESSHEDAGGSDLKKQFTILNTKLDRLISAIEAQTRAISIKE
ncbi:MAG: CxxC-x17-CxxC domain-containing protein [Minisyncoccia bacterium]